MRQGNVRCSQCGKMAACTLDKTLKGFACAPCLSTALTRCTAQLKDVCEIYEEDQAEELRKMALERR